MTVTVQMPFTSAVKQCTRTPLWAPLWKTARRLARLICASTTFNRNSARRPGCVGGRKRITSMGTHCRRFTFRFPTASSSRRVPPSMSRTNGGTFPGDQGVSTSQHMSHSVIRLACSLAVGCGQPQAHCAPLFRAVPEAYSKSSIKR